MLRTITSLLLIIECAATFAQQAGPNFGVACNTSLRQMYLWCGKQQQPSFLSGQKCGESMQDVDKWCYGENSPQLACRAAQTQSELWCGGQSTIEGFMAGQNCADAQNKVRKYCYPG